MADSDADDRPTSKLGRRVLADEPRTTERDFRRFADNLLSARVGEAEDATRIEPPLFDPDEIPTGVAMPDGSASPDDAMEEEPPTNEMPAYTAERYAAELRARERRAAASPLELAPTGLSADVAAPAMPEPSAARSAQDDAVFAPTVAQASAAPQPAPTQRRAPTPRPTPAPHPAAASVPSSNNVVVMFGCRGGSGATTLAVNCGAMLARAGKKVCVLDLDLQLGDVFVSLNLEPTTSIVQLSREAANLSEAALLRRLVRHGTGLHALSQVGNVSEIDSELARRIPALLARLARDFELVIVDGPRDFDDFALAALDTAARICLVVTQDVPAMRRAARTLSIIRQIGYSDRKLRLVVNRYGDRMAMMDDAAIEKTLGVPISARVRNDHRTIRGAIDRGLLLDDVAPKAGVTRDVAAVADLLAGTKAAVEPKPAKKRGLFSRMFGGG